MVKSIQTPTRGQPIDASFLSDMATAVNEIIAAIDSRKGRASIQATEPKVTESRSTANTSFFASTFKVSIPSDQVNTDTKGTATVKFSGVAFNGPPIVTATPVITGTLDDAARTATVVISEINKAGCVVNVSFAKSGTVKDLYVHVIAIGIPA